ncbi:MAG: DUF1398 family protein [Parvibaculum sp.]|nr:DUF1398 family protein [Parvibaculum sp.]|tara:strand:- start:335 stop:736 length:402 start_codon:yes stop_codon:yes gene_type:complete
MTDDKVDVAQTCLAGAEDNSMSFPQIIGALMQAGFESYEICFRGETATYYLPDGESLELATHKAGTPVAPALNVSALQAAISEAQQQVAGYTYKGFCEKAKAAGCARYIVSLSGRRALYIGRDAATHTEFFPD